MSKAKINVLLVVASPPGSSRLMSDSEVRTIQESIELSRGRNQVNIIIRPAATIRDLSRALMNIPFDVVHISGHGYNTGLVLADEQGGMFLVKQDTLAELLSEYKSSLQCVILNACYSATQGALIAQEIPFTVMMDGPLTDKAAIKFSEGFYDALGAGRSIEFAFREGLRRIKFESSTLRLPRLIKLGEASLIEENTDRNITTRLSERIQLSAGKALIGLAIDLSGSMETSIHNKNGEDISRLEEVQRSLKDLMNNACESLRDNQTKNIQTYIDVFAYGFGLRTMPVCDLLSLMKASREVITKELTREVTEQYKREVEKTYGEFKGLASALQRLGFKGVIDAVSEFGKRQGETVVRRRVINKVKAQLEERLQKIGDITLSLEEVAEMWEEQGEILAHAKELIFGNTPIKEVLSAITGRFEREVQIRDKDTHLILLLVSDGKFTDIDPHPLLEKLRAMGVTIISCFLSDQDYTRQRVLVNAPEPHWSQDATLMFEIASTRNNDWEIFDSLLHDGWMIHPQAKLFVQLNHSEVLKEFVQIVLGPLEASDTERMLPRGW